MGVLVGGVGGRLAMLILRLTSPASVRGVESDDGFTIGRISTSTFFLLAAAAAIGVAGALIYRLLAPSLAGSTRVRRLTVIVAAAVIGGGVLVNPGGVDFTLLEPLWLAVLLFVAIPAAFGAAIVPVIERWDSPDAWVSRGRFRPWVLLGVTLFIAPFVFPIALIACALMIAWALVDRIPAAHQFRQGFGRIIVRVGWALFGALSVFILVDDLVAL